MASLKYYPQLDALRAFAVFGVMIQHFYDTSLHWGVFGVRLFFVLSGFLITSIILTHRNGMQESGASAGLVAKNFYIRRSLRLFPIYYLTLFIIIGLSLSTGSNIGNILDAWPFHFLYLTNFVIFVQDSWIGTISHFWTLAVEEQFYLMWFWVVLLAKRSWLPGITIMIFLLGPIYRGIAFSMGLNEFANLLLPGCFDFLALGSLLGLMVHPSYKDLLGRTREFWMRRTNLITAMALIAAVLAAWIDATRDPSDPVFRIVKGPLSAFFFVWLVYGAYKGIGGWAGKVLDSRILIYLGKISYGIYVYHALSPNIFKPAAASVKAALSAVPILEPYFAEVRLLMLTVITIGLASASWYLIEKPVNHLKQRYSEGIGSHI